MSAAVVVLTDGVESWLWRRPTPRGGATMRDNHARDLVSILQDANYRSEAKPMCIVRLKEWKHGHESRS